MYTLTHNRNVIQKGTLFKYETSTISLPPNAQWAVVTSYQNKFRLEGWNLKGVQSYQTHDDKTYDWMVQNTHKNKNEPTIAHTLQQGTKVMAVSDGLFHLELQHGVTMWIIKLEDSET